jgi:3-phosphoshikimate 1-carboxyvinyltransferase
MTLDVMRSMGVEALDTADRFIVPAYQRYRAETFAIEPDASAATYFWAAAAITGGRVRVEGLSRRSRQGDVAFVDVLAQMGCVVEEERDAIALRGPRDGELRGVDADLNAMPDTVQTLAVAAVFARGATHIRNVGNLRIKETDRLAALASELTKLGARVELREDGLTIDPPAKAQAAEIATYDDHRMAMSFAIAGLRIAGIEIQNPACVSKSFPGFFEELARLGKAVGM